MYRVVSVCSVLSPALARHFLGEIRVRPQCPLRLLVSLAFARLPMPPATFEAFLVAAMWSLVVHLGGCGIKAKIRRASGAAF
jgi:hypothetical protein